MTKSKRIRASLGFARTPDANLVTRLNAVHDAMSGNPAYPAPPVDLATFKTDLALSERLIPRFPREVIAVSESGIATGADAARVRAAGAHAVLVGEALMKAVAPAALIAELRGHV